MEHSSGEVSRATRTDEDEQTYQRHNNSGIVPAELVHRDPSCNPKDHKQSRRDNHHQRGDVELPSLIVDPIGRESHAFVADHHELRWQIMLDWI